ncbi:thioredoxin-like protein 1-like protein [Cladochytrium replicatum]|nr:thioredoxin-like protein 1-like protein [Cladochytrium replicatum]
MSSLVKNIRSEQDLAAHIGQLGKTSVVMWSSTTCAPCQAIKPFFSELSLKYRNVSFGIADTDQLHATPTGASVTSTPTFQFYKNGSKVAEISGANPPALEAAVIQHQIKDESSSVVPGHSDLTEYIHLSQVECLNESSDHSVSALFKKDGYLESDVDEQLIITIPFNQAVKLHSLKVVASGENAPKAIKTFVNRPQTVGFDEADGLPETETLTFTEKEFDSGAALKALRYVKYQGVHSVQLFIPGNLGDAETTVIKQLIFYGTPVETTKMTDIKKLGGEH